MLLNEYALEPEVLGSKTNFQILAPQIGASQGRLIARFPRDWKKRVYAAAHSGAKTTELAWIEEKLRRLDDSALFSRGRTGGDPELPWIARALAEHRREPFAAIVGSVARPDVLTLDDLDNAASWQVSRQCEVPRRARDMADAISLIFLSGSQFKIIDPHLDPSKRRFRNTLVEFLRRIGSRPQGVQDGSVECHVMTTGNQDEERRFVDNFKAAMEGKIPVGLSLSLHLHPAALMHDRFVLSPWAGADFGQGLDEGDRPQRVKITLLEESIRASKWGEFGSDHPALNLNGA